MNWREHIHSDPTVLLGKPTIKGTRLSVELILELFELGWTKDKILESYPKLTETNIKAVFAYLKSCLKPKSYLDVEENVLSEVHESSVMYGSKKEKPFDMMDYYGTITIDMSDEQLFDELNQLRSEWDRDF
jgi:uncharacterized protein (DUF433 family)